MSLVLLTAILGITRRQTPHTSPWILFMTDRDGQPTMYRMFANGSGQQQLAFSNQEQKFPRWSPNSTWVIFESRENGVMNIYRRRTDSTQSENLTQNAGNNWLPVWSSPVTLTWRPWLNALSGLLLIGMFRYFST